MPVVELSVWGRVRWRGVALARLRRRGERAGGVGSRRGLCEGMRVRGGGAVTDGGLRVLGRGSFGVLCWRGGGRYEGEYRDGQKNGRGIYTYPDGAR